MYVYVLYACTHSHTFGCHKRYNLTHGCSSGGDYGMYIIYKYIYIHMYALYVCVCVWGR